LDFVFLDTEHIPIGLAHIPDERLHFRKERIPPASASKRWLRG